MRRIDLYRLLKRTKRAAMIALGVAQMTSFEVMAVGFDVLDLGPLGHELRCPREPNPDGFNDRGGSVVLNCEDILHLAVEAFGQELIAACNVGEVCGYPQASPGSPDAALQDVAD